MSARSANTSMEEVRLDFGDDGRGSGGGGSGGTDDALAASLSTQVAAVVGQEVLKAGSARATSFVSSYARIDLLRPYFDVEPADIRARLLVSLWPRYTRPPVTSATTTTTTVDETATTTATAAADSDAAAVSKAPPLRSSSSSTGEADLYGPVMLALTLSAVLLMSMKAGNVVTRRESTYIGTAFAVSFGYWIGASVLFSAVGFVFNTDMSTVETLSATGYGLTGYILVLIIGGLRRGLSADFYYAWFTVGILSAAALGVRLRACTPDSKQGLIVGIIAFAVHWIYLGYLKYAYMGIFDAAVSLEGGG